MASLSGSAASASAFVTSDRIAFGILLAPQFNFFFLGAFYAPLPHLLVVLNLCLRKLSVLPENDVETKSEDAQSD